MLTPPQSIPFDPADPKAALTQLPQSPAVFALYAAEAHAEPYIGRTPNLRGRLERLLQPSAKHPRRLQLASRVRRIEWRLTGSDFESLLLQFELLEKVYGPKSPGQSLARMHLGAPAFIRFLGSNAYPRITVTNRPSQREADWAYGPFQSRAAAERFADEALKLFLLRRCTDDLDPNPAHPGCVYSEMKMCLAPCYKGCTDERYTEESSAVENFLATRGESRLVPLRTQRDEASANLEFESAAALHAQVHRVEAIRSLAPEIVRPLSQLRALILQPAANPDDVSVFLFQDGLLRGPQTFSTLGMRIQNEQSSSLFAQPMALEPVPEKEEIRDQGSGIRDQGSGISGQGSGISGQGSETRDQASGISFDTSEIGPEPVQGTSFEVKGTAVDAKGTGVQVKGTGFSPYIEPPKTGRALAPEGIAPLVPTKLPRTQLESRLEAVLAALAQPPAQPLSPTIRQGHLALLKRWYYRPEIRRTGEIFFPDPEGQWPLKAILRGIGRVAAKALHTL